MAETADAGKKAGKKNGKLLYGIVGVLVLAGAGGYWYTRPAAETQQDAKSKAKEKQKEKEAEGAEPGMVLAFEPLVVNLADGNGTRFLRVTVQLVIGGEENEELAKNAALKARLRAIMLDLFSQQTSEQLVTPEGKAAVKDAIKEQGAKLLELNEVSDVLFTDFLVQF
jgi:flagellar FliL protein